MVGVDKRPGGVDGGVHGCLDVNRLEPKLDTAARDAGQIEQILDQPHHVRHLAPDEVDGVLPFLGTGAFMLQQAQRIGNGRQGVAQLVGERRQEFVLAPGVKLQLLLRSADREELLPNLILPAPGLDGGAHGANEGDDPHRTLEHRHVAERLHQPRRSR